MLKAHLSDGRTLRFSLEDEEDARRWRELAKTAAFQAQLRALSLSVLGVQYSLPRPQGFESVFLHAERLGSEAKARESERLVCFAGDVTVQLVAHAGQRASRVDLRRTGRQRFNPLAL